MKRLLLAFTFLGSVSPVVHATEASIAALVDEIGANNPELAYFEAEVGAAQAGARGATASAHDPELELTLGRKRTRDAAGTPTGDGTAWSVSVAHTFDWPGRAALRKAIANRDVALAELGLERFRAALTARARMVACGLWAAQERAAAAEEVAGRFRALKETFLAREPGGITPLLETRVIEAQEIVLQRRATETTLALHAALVELNQLRGAAADAPLRVVPVKPVFHPAPALTELLQSARERNFEFRARQLELAQQGFVVQLARHERRPSLTVSPFVEREEAGDRESTAGVGFSLAWPLSARTGAAVASAEARRLQAEASLQVAHRALEREVVTTAGAFSAHLAEIERWTPDAIASFREAAELADRHYRLGAVALGTYVELQGAYLDAVDALLETQREALEAGLRLQLLTGLEFNAVELIAP